MTDDVELVVRERADEAARAAGMEIAMAAARGGNIALSGGSARAAYEVAAAHQADWGAVDLWWADERCVPPGDERSNFQLVRESLLDRLAEPPRALHRIEGELPAEDAAALYDGALRGVVLDLAVLGIGPDGHTASLFPDSPSLDVRERRAVPAAAQLEPFVDRVTLTIPALSASAVALFLVTGAGKAEAAARAFAGRPTRATPASLVRGHRTVAFLDRAAAARLESGGQPDI